MTPERMRHAWIIFRDGRPIGIALDKQIAEQAVLNCQRYDAIPPVDGSKHEYDIPRSVPVYTKKFVAPKGYAKERSPRDDA